MVGALTLRRAARALARGTRALHRDRRGSYLFEFALVFNVLLIVMLLTLETAFQMGIDMALNHGARESSRQAALGPSVSGAVTTQAALVDRVLDRTGLPLRAWGTATITAEQFASYAALAAAPQFGNNATTGQKQCATSGTTATTGVSGGVIRYCIIYQARAFTPYARLMLPNAGSIFTHRTFFVVQNEPY
jgi:Flp pilus assembly protein TadG